MPVTHAGRGQHSVQRAIIERLARAVNLRPAGGATLNMWDVHNPDPRKWQYRWCVPENYRRYNLTYGAEKVTVKKAVEYYKIVEDSATNFDKANDRVLRGGQMLIEYSPDAYAARMALGPYLSMKNSGLDIDAFGKDPSARMVDHDGERALRNRRVQKVDPREERERIMEERQKRTKNSPVSKDGKRLVPSKVHMADVIANQEDYEPVNQRTTSPRKISRTPKRPPIEELLEMQEAAAKEVPVIGAMSVEELDGDDLDEFPDE